MLFNSFEFAVFFLIVFVSYWSLARKSVRAQNVLLLAASYVFYGWWSWRFLGLLIILSCANYLLGIALDKNRGDTRKKWVLAAGLTVNLGVLGIFKYFDFFIEGFVDLVSLFGYELPRSTIKIILPVGISFYTFLSVSYLIDIYKRSITAHRDIVDVFLSLSFFPIILAGPIQRPSSLLPQISSRREFDYKMGISGFWQVLWGLATKVIVADNLAVLVDDIFTNSSRYPGSILLLGALFFSVQIYVDFSAYSNMSIGIARMLGFNLMRNFAYPYFSRDIVEFWKRWHISLTTWFRDYIFLPMSFNLAWRLKNEKVLFIRKDIFIYIVVSLTVWVLTGLWHGANYTFILWGLIHGLALIIFKLQINPRKVLFKKLGISNKNKIVTGLDTLITLTVVIVAWVFFRADSIKDAIEYLDRTFSITLFTLPKLVGIQNTDLLLSVLLALTMFIVEWRNRHSENVFELISTRSIYYQAAVFISLVAGIYLFSGEPLDFIYFKF